MTAKQGKIIIPKHTIIQPHELAVATILSWTGHKVEFIPLGPAHTADIRFEGKEWEIKSPKGKSSRTIENNMRLALRQAENIIIDLSRIRMPEEKAMREIKRQFHLYKQAKRLLIITKNHKIIHVYK